MTCIKAQGMITPFINNKLDIKDTEEFLEHVKSCPDCMEELEFYYTLLTGMKQLDEDKNLSNNFRLELSGAIKKAEEKIVHARYTYYRKISILILFMILLAFLFGISYAEESSEKSLENKYTDGKFRAKRDDFIEIQVEEYLMQQSTQDNTLLIYKSYNQK